MGSKCPSAERPWERRSTRRRGSGRHRVTEYSSLELEDHHVHVVAKHFQSLPAARALASRLGNDRCRVFMFIAVASLVKLLLQR